LRTLTYQDLLDLVDGAAIFSAGGGGAIEGGYKIADELAAEGYAVRLIAPSEVPNEAKAVNFACVGATITIEYDSEAALKTLKALENYAGFSVFATIPVELGGFNTLAAVDVGARRGIPVVDADGAGRSVPEVHLKVYTIDGIHLTPMVVADVHAKNMVVVKETADAKAAERIARILAAEWNHTAYTARRILTGAQVKTSPIQLSLSKSINVGRILRKAVEPVKAVLKETGGLKLFEGVVDEVEQQTREGFTFINVKLHGTREYNGSMFELRAKNEVLAAYRDGRLAAVAPDIITPVHPEKGNCVTAEKIEKGDKLAVLGLPTPEKWKTQKGLELWHDVLQRAEIKEEYVSIVKLTS
jgi:uncharacterized protein